MKNLIIILSLFLFPITVLAVMGGGYDRQRVEDLFSFYGYTPNERDISWWGDNSRNQWGDLEDNLFRRAIGAGDLVQKIDLGAGTLPFAGATYNLAGSGISSSVTSITLQSLTIPQTGQEIVDADLSDTFYLTLEPGNRTKQEIVSCTTVTQNSGSTATLSGCSRGLAPISPYTASTTLQFAHAGGATVIFSDPPQLFNLYSAKTNDETIVGKWTYNVFPEYKNGTTVATTAPQFITKYQLDLAAPGTFGSGNIGNGRTMRINGTTPETLDINTSTVKSFVINDGKFELNTSTLSEANKLFNNNWNTTTTKPLLTTFSDGLHAHASSSVQGNFRVDGNATSTGSFSFGELCNGGVNCRVMGANGIVSSTVATSSVANNTEIVAGQFTTKGGSLGSKGVIKVSGIIYDANSAGGTSNPYVKLSQATNNICSMFFTAHNGFANYAKFEFYLTNDNAQNAQKIFGNVYAPSTTALPAQFGFCANTATYDTSANITWDIELQSQNINNLLSLSNLVVETFYFNP